MASSCRRVVSLLRRSWSSIPASRNQLGYCLTSSYKGERCFWYHGKLGEELKNTYVLCLPMKFHPVDYPCVLCLRLFVRVIATWPPRQWTLHSQPTQNQLTKKSLGFSRGFGDGWMMKKRNMWVSVCSACSRACANKLQRVLSLSS